MHNTSGCVAANTSPAALFAAVLTQVPGVLLMILSVALARRKDTA